MYKRPTVLKFTHSINLERERGGLQTKERKHGKEGEGGEKLKG